MWIKFYMQKILFWHLFPPPAILCTSALTFHRLCSVSIEKRLDAKICSRAKYYHLCILKMPIRILSKMLHGFHSTRKLKCKGKTYYSNEEELQLAPAQHWRTMNQRAVSSYWKRQSFVPVCTICSFHITCVFFFLRPGATAPCVRAKLRKLLGHGRKRCVSPPRPAAVNMNTKHLLLVSAAGKFLPTPASRNTEVLRRLGNNWELLRLLMAVFWNITYVFRVCGVCFFFSKREVLNIFAPRRRESVSSACSAETAEWAWVLTCSDTPQTLHCLTRLLLRGTSATAVSHACWSACVHFDFCSERTATSLLCRLDSFALSAVNVSYW